MSVTYTDNTLNNTNDTTDFVPAYARGTRRKKPVRTWMILAPIGALALIGGGAAMMLQGGESPTPLAEPAPVAAQPLAVQPLTPAAPLESSTLPDNASASIAPPTPAPVVSERRADPAPVVQRRQSAPVERRAEPVQAAPSVETAPEPIGPQPYTATQSLNAAPTAPTTAPAAPAPATRAPAIQTAPLN